MRISKSNYINDIDYQKQIIDSFPEPQSDYDRVDFNYLVLRKVKGISVKRLIFEVASVTEKERHMILKEEFQNLVLIIIQFLYIKPVHFQRLLVV